jgi:hypothetical protein
MDGLQEGLSEWIKVVLLRIFAPSSAQVGKSRRPKGMLRKGRRLEQGID